MLVSLLPEAGLEVHRLGSIARNVPIEPTRVLLRVSKTRQINGVPVRVKRPLPRLRVYSVIGDRWSKGPVGRLTDHVAGCPVECSPDCPSYERYELRQVHHAPLAELGQKPETDPLVDFNQDRPGDLLQSLDRDLPAERDSGRLNDVLHCRPDHAEQNRSPHLIVLGVMPVDFGDRRHHRCLDRKGRRQRAWNRHGHRQHATKSGHDPNCSVFGDSPPDERLHPFGVVRIGLVPIVVGQVGG